MELINIDQYYDYIKLGKHVRITPLKFMSRKMLYTLYQFIEKISTTTNPILYCIEHHNTPNEHLHMIVSTKQADLLKDHIKKQGAKGNKCSSFTDVKKQRTIVKYILKDGNYTLHSFTETLEKDIKKIFNCSFRKITEWKDVLIPLQDKYLTQQIHLHDYMKDYIGLCIKFNREKLAGRHLLRQHFDWIELRHSKLYDHKRYKKTINNLIKYMVPNSFSEWNC